MTGHQNSVRGNVIQYHKRPARHACLAVWASIHKNLFNILWHVLRGSQVLFMIRFSGPFVFQGDRRSNGRPSVNGVTRNLVGRWAGPSSSTGRVWAQPCHQIVSSFSFLRSVFSSHGTVSYSSIELFAWALAQCQFVSYEIQISTTRGRNRSRRIFQLSCRFWAFEAVAYIPLLSFAINERMSGYIFTLFICGNVHLLVVVSSAKS